MGPARKSHRNKRWLNNFDQWQNEEMVWLTTEQRVIVVWENDRTYSLIAVQKHFAKDLPHNPPNVN